MTDPALSRPSRFRTGGLSPRKPTRFSYRPDADQRAELARELGLIALRSLDLSGEIMPSGRDTLILTATLKASADQACIVSLVPVRAELAEPVRRRFVAGLADPDGEEAEMPEDETTEPMPEHIDLAELAAEALALALPLYPRAPGAEFGAEGFAPDGVTPMSDADLKPFAGLQGLAKRFAAKDKSGPEDA